jgi:predicted HTH transcriptional regulator
MSSYLENKVRERQVRLLTLQRELDMVTAELRAYEDALRHTQGRSTTVQQETTQLHQDELEAEPSGHWVKIVGQLSKQPRFTTDDVEQEFEKLGLKIQRKSIRSKLAVLVKEGKLHRHSDGVFSSRAESLLTSVVDSRTTNEFGLTRANG